MYMPLPNERLGDFLEAMDMSPLQNVSLKGCEQLCEQTLLTIVADLRKMTVVCCGKKHEDPESMLVPGNCALMKFNLACGHIREDICHRLRSYLWLARQLQLLQQESEHAGSPMVLVRKLELELNDSGGQSFILDDDANRAYLRAKETGVLDLERIRDEERRLGARVKVIRDALLGAFASILQEYEASSR